VLHIKSLLFHPVLFQTSTANFTEQANYCFHLLQIQLSPVSSPGPGSSAPVHLSLSQPFIVFLMAWARIKHNSNQWLELSCFTCIDHQFNPTHGGLQHLPLQIHHLKRVKKGRFSLLYIVDHLMKILLVEKVRLLIASKEVFQPV